MKPSGNNQTCWYYDLGLTAVPQAEAIMSVMGTKRLHGELHDLLLFMAHPRTVALGLRHGAEEHPKDLLVTPQRLEDEGIALTRSVRGGGITYHWPGQVVCYPVLHLGPGERDVPAYMYRLEEVGILTMKQFGVVVARRRASAAHVGLWIDDRKLVSMGIRIARWVTSFGFVINVGGEHRPSAYIRPCGIEGATIATLEEIIGYAPPRSHVIRVVKESFGSVFGRSLKPMPVSLVKTMCSPASSGDAPLTESG